MCVTWGQDFPRTQMKGWRLASTVEQILQRTRSGVFYGQDFPRTQMKGWPESTVGPDRYRQNVFSVKSVLGCCHVVLGYMFPPI